MMTKKGKHITVQVKYMCSYFVMIKGKLCTVNITYNYIYSVYTHVYVTGFTKTVLNCTIGNSRNTELKY